MQKFTVKTGGVDEGRTRLRSTCFAIQNNSLQVIDIEMNDGRNKKKN